MHTKKFLSLKYIELKQCGSLFPQSPSSLQTSELGRCLLHIELYECNEMTHLCSTSISRNLTNLQVLVLQECEMTKELVHICGEIEQVKKIELNALKILKLRDLSRLECFCKGINEVHFQNLKTLELHGLKQFIFPSKLEIPCLEELSMISIPNITTLCLPPSLQNLEIDSCDNFQYVDFTHNSVISHLESLIITRCKMLKGVVGVTSSAEEQQKKSIEFPNLSTLELKSLDKLASFVIDINKKEKSQSALFYQYDYQVSFPCLQYLKIKELSKINYIIGRKSGQIGGHRGDIQQPILLLFPNLKTLMLEHLEELLSIVGVIINNKDNNCENKNALFHPDDEVSFPCLKELYINELSKINYIVGWKEGGRQREGHHHNKIFHVLIYLFLTDLSNLIHMYEINQSRLGMLLFQNMIILDIKGCGKLRYLFSENILRTADRQLKELNIYNCGMMEVVMKKGEELIEDDDDKFGEGGGSTHFFPLLWSVRLLNLSGLKSFSDVAYTWVLPSLKYLIVSNCPMLEALSPGYLDSPRLENLQYARGYVNVKNTWKGDVNSALRHLFTKEEDDEESEDYIESEDDEE